MLFALPALATTPEISAGRWSVTPAPRPTLLNHRAVLALLPTAEAVRYAVHSGWAETVAGAARRTRLARTVELHVAAPAARCRLTLRTANTRLHPPAATAFDDLALLLADLYEELVVDVAPTGHWLSLANAAAIGPRWARVQQALARQYPAGSEVVDALVAGIGRQLARPAGLWPSLPSNYLYAALPGSFYGQPFETNQQYTRPKAFAQFFDGQALHFTETLRLAAPDDPAHVVLELTGTPDLTATDVAAVAARVGAAFGSGHPAVAPEELRFTYFGTHSFEKSTGLPARVELTVSCAYQNLYHKEYHLVINAIPSTNLPL